MAGVCTFPCVRVHAREKVGKAMMRDAVYQFTPGGAIFRHSSVQINAADFFPRLQVVTDTFVDPIKRKKAIGGLMTLTTFFVTIVMFWMVR